MVFKNLGNVEYLEVGRLTRKRGKLLFSQEAVIVSRIECRYSWLFVKTRQNITTTGCMGNLLNGFSWLITKQHETYDL